MEGSYYGLSVSIFLSILVTLFLYFLNIFICYNNVIFSNYINYTIKTG